MVPIDELHAGRHGDPHAADGPLNAPGAGEDPVVTRLHGRYDHGDRKDTMGGRLRTAFLLTIVILAVEIAGGALARSLALIADAGHVLTDLFALGLAFRRGSALIALQQRIALKLLFAILGEFDI